MATRFNVACNSGPAGHTSRNLVVAAVAQHPKPAESKWKHLQSHLNSRYIQIVTRMMEIMFSMHSKVKRTVEEPWEDARVEDCPPLREIHGAGLNNQGFGVEVWV